MPSTCSVELGATIAGPFAAGTSTFVISSGSASEEQLEIRTIVRRHSRAPSFFPQKFAKAAGPRLAGVGWRAPEFSPPRPTFYFLPGMLPPLVNSIAVREVHAQ